MMPMKRTFQKSCKHRVNVKISGRFVVYFFLNICNRSAATKLLDTVTRLLTDCSRLYHYADRKTAENLIVRLEVALYSSRLVNSSSKCLENTTS